jgi:hypothetical protein
VGSVGAAGSVGGVGSVDDDIAILQRQLLDFYQAHCPERVAEVSGALAKLQDPDFKARAGAAGTIAWLMEEMRAQAMRAQDTPMQSQATGGEHSAGGVGKGRASNTSVEYHSGTIDYEEEEGGVHGVQYHGGAVGYEEDEGGVHGVQYHGGAVGYEEEEGGVHGVQYHGGAVGYEEEEGGVHGVQYHSGTIEYEEEDDDHTTAPRAKTASSTRDTVLQVIASRTEGMNLHDARELAARFVEQLGATGHAGGAAADLTEVLAELRAMSETEWDAALSAAAP